jgi:hypothetical protein
MSPANKFHGSVSVFTVGSVYWIMAYVSTWLPPVEGLPTWEKAIIAYITSAAVYQLTATGLRGLLDRWRWAREWTLGAAYVEGTWIGCYKTAANENRITVEHFEQTLDRLTIRGYAFTENSNSPIIDWTSKAASVDESLGMLTFSYSCDIRTTPPQQFEGIANFKFERTNTKTPPEWMNGYSADLTDGVFSPNREHLLSREQVDLPTAWKKTKEQKLC